ncbi:Ty3/Gypsy family RNase HI domain-containing protein [Klebsiella pneumoniae]|uniref:Ty3/Gypsy family RNase HI domain-containing protein n=1 Tax=Klebsiella pneumoniae TaxID=573 RepID=UPI0040558B74
MPDSDKTFQPLISVVWTTEFASKKFKPAETRYSATERELLAIVWAVEHFRPYVWGRHFAIKTDHMPLKWLAKLKETTAKITRWKARLAAYDFEVHHTKGKENIVADTLSRLVNNNELREQEVSEARDRWFDDGECPARCDTADGIGRHPVDPIQSN